MTHLAYQMPNWSRGSNDRFTIGKLTLVLPITNGHRFWPIHGRSVAEAEADQVFRKSMNTKSFEACNSPYGRLCAFF
jgi:hypothetical protein